MQHEIKLFSLFESCRCPLSHLVYCDGTNTYSLHFDDLHKNVCFVSELLEHLYLSKSLICSLIKPSLALPAIILGILKVSSTFAFLDVYRPIQSLSAFQKHLEVKILLIEECFLKIFESKLCHCWKKIKQFSMHSDFLIFQSTKCKNLACPNSQKYKEYIRQSEIAYVVQTSGTTGEPKVVQVPHDCITSNIIDFRSRFSVTADDVILQSTRITFDPSIIEIFLSLSSGATLVIIADHIRSTPKKLIEVIISNNITIIQGTPSLISNFGEKIIREELLKKDSVLRILAFGGEICPSVNKLKRWKSEGNKTEIFNLYGLTELSCWASSFRIKDFTKDSLPNIPIGECLLNTKFEIRNRDGQIANEGELYIGGQKRFCIINNEEWPEDCDHFMRPTGDLVHKAPDGFIYFDGRNDSIIKYMGQKISLQLVIQVIETFPEIANHFLHFNTSEARLYLFAVLSSNSHCKAGIKSKLAKCLEKRIPHLPPIIVVAVPFIPLTKHGKGDGEKLMNLVNKNKNKRICTDGHIERDKNWDDVISVFWKNYTNQCSVKDNDTFILKGGNSILAVQLAAEIEWSFQLSLPLLVEKILNESYKDITSYIKLCLKDYQPSVQFQENYSSSINAHNKPLLEKRCYDKSQCFKVCSKKRCFEDCIHVRDSKSCFSKNSEIFETSNLHLRLLFKWDLKKCIDATPCILHLPLSDQLFIFTGSHFGVFSCIDVNQVSEKWQILVPGRIESSACISACGNYVLFGCYDHHLYCINIADGNIQWMHKTNAEVKSSPSVSSNNTVFVGSHDKHIYAIDIESGLVSWKKQVASGSIFSSPAIIETMSAVCVSTLDGVLALLNMESGDILWKYHSEKPLFSSPLVISNFILIGSTDKCMLGLDFDGNVKFRYATDGPVFSSATYHKDFKEYYAVFGCHDFYLHCITINGDLVWKTPFDSAVYATPFTFMWNENYYVCIASSKGTIYILKLEDGKIVYSWNCPGEIFSSPVILNDILVIGCRDNNIYCFNIINFIPV